VRWLHLTIIVLCVAAIALFGIQNVQLVTMSFLRFSVSAPLALLTAIAYILGAITGGSLLAVLRKSYRATREGWPAR
jgi:lipopolysaccharide assembly protein A